jgi:hypothetical protein
MQTGFLSYATIIAYSGVPALAFTISEDDTCNGASLSHPTKPRMQCAEKNAELVKAKPGVGRKLSD